MKNKNIQAKYRKQFFDVPQYWNISYTEKYSNKTEKDFKTFIKARSYESAKIILLDRLREDDPEIKIKSIHGHKFHDKYKDSNNVKLRTVEWEQIRSASFPNQNNTLFKLEVPRAEGKSNRFNWTNHEHLKTIGFKKGKDNWSSINVKGKTLPKEERAGMVYKGKWIRWNKEIMDKTRKSLISALIMDEGNRSKAARRLNISRHKFYSLLEKFPEINWRKDYPPKHPAEGGDRSIK